MKDELQALSDKFKSYNLGCGDLIYPQFLNIGYWEGLQEGVIYKNINGTNDTYMLNHDLRRGIPAKDESLDLVYHAHLFEHLSYSEGIDFLLECRRVLKKNARMRILVPDLELWIKAYASDDLFFFKEYAKILDPKIYQTKGSIFMGMLHNHDHKCGYDFETLKWVLEFAGFDNVTKKLYADSELDNIKSIEPMNPLRIMETLCVECVKK